MKSRFLYGTCCAFWELVFSEMRYGSGVAVLILGSYLFPDNDAYTQLLNKIGDTGEVNQTSCFWD